MNGDEMEVIKNTIKTIGYVIIAAAKKRSASDAISAGKQHHAEYADARHTQFERVNVMNAPPAQWLIGSPLWCFDTLQKRGVHFINLHMVPRIERCNAITLRATPSNRRFQDNQRLRCLSYPSNFR